MDRDELDKRTGHHSPHSYVYHRRTHKDFKADLTYKRVVYGLVIFAVVGYGLYRFVVNVLF
jgi:hypothetical protein